MRKEIARRRIDSFARSFSEAHLYLAYHAAFPLALTPDLLYRLWANFQRDISGQFLNIPWVAVVDILLSPLCEEVGQELYEMQGATRNMLLTRLEEDARFGRERIKELSEFLIAYVRQQLHSSDPDDRDFAEAQYWTALAYVRPSDAARELAIALKKAYTQDRMELLRIASVVETFAEPLAEFEPLLVYARGMERFAQGDLEGAASQLEEIVEPGSSLQFAGVSLPIPTKALHSEKVTAATAGDRASEVKLVVLSLGEGSFEQGFPAVMRIGIEGDRPFLEIAGKLPAASDFLQDYRDWQLAFSGIKGEELEAKSMLTNVYLKLKKNLNSWLESPDFIPIIKRFRSEISRQEEVRVIVECFQEYLWRLPWHLWELFYLYPKAELALSFPKYERVASSQKQKQTKVRILAIMGNRAGIDIEKDRAILEALHGAEISFLIEPMRQHINDKLWEQPCDILFFAGQSRTQRKTGLIFINETDSLTVDELRNALKQSISRGLQIAIFNSCDGLGLARQLADLQIPQIVVMREPVKDEVAQKFLTYFLQAFASGQFFYLAVRQARERLQVLEDRFPYASLLPVIVQNPAAVPPTWQDLLSGDRS